MFQTISHHSELPWQNFWQAIYTNRYGIEQNEYRPSSGEISFSCDHPENQKRISALLEAKNCVLFREEENVIHMRDRVELNCMISQNADKFRPASFFLTQVDNNWANRSSFSKSENTISSMKEFQKSSNGIWMDMNKSIAWQTIKKLYGLLDHFFGNMFLPVQVKQLILYMKTISCDSEPV